MHLAAARVDAAGGLQQFLISLDLLDPPPPPAPGSPEAAAAEAAAAVEAAARQVAEQQALAERPWWHRYLPVRRMSDTEWEEYKAQQDEAQRKRCGGGHGWGVGGWQDLHVLPFRCAAHADGSSCCNAHPLSAPV